jgi:hypothetical protein
MMEDTPPTPTTEMVGEAPTVEPEPTEAVEPTNTPFSEAEPTEEKPAVLR